METDTEKPSEQLMGDDMVLQNGYTTVDTIKNLQSDESRDLLSELSTDFNDLLSETVDESVHLGENSVEEDKDTFKEAVPMLDSDSNHESIYITADDEQLNDLSFGESPHENGEETATGEGFVKHCDEKAVPGFEKQGEMVVDVMAEGTPPGDGRTEEHGVGEVVNELDNGFQEHSEDGGKIVDDNGCDNGVDFRDVAVEDREDPNNSGDIIHGNGDGDNIHYEAPVPEDRALSPEALSAVSSELSGDERDGVYEIYEDGFGPEEIELSEDQSDILKDNIAEIIHIMMENHMTEEGNLAPCDMAGSGEDNDVIDVVENGVNGGDKVSGDGNATVVVGLDGGSGVSDVPVNGRVSEKGEKIIGIVAEDVMANEGEKQEARNITTTDFSGKIVSSPAGLGGAAPLLEPATRAAHQHRVNGTVPSQEAENPGKGEVEEFDETREKLQMIRMKFLRLAHRLGQTSHNVVVAQVLYRLGLAEQLRGKNGARNGTLGFDRANSMAQQLESRGEPLDFSCTIMVLGKTGVGKSATINSIFDEVKFRTDPFQPGTQKVQDVVGVVHGIKVRVIDTPGLLPFWSDMRKNQKILRSVKRFIKTTPPDIVLYLDRLDVQSKEFGDMPILRAITDVLGPSVWFNAIVVLTHAASAPPESPSGTTPSYDLFVTQRSHIVQQAIRRVSGDVRLMNPVSLVENHSACRTNRAGQRVLPNGQVWKPHLLLLSFASKILAEANALLKLQDSVTGMSFSTRPRSASLPVLLSSLLQPRSQVKIPDKQIDDDDDDLADDLGESSESDDDMAYDDLPPFRSLTETKLANLTKAEKKAYYEELEYREKLFMKKQLKDEKRRQRMAKRSAKEANEPPNGAAEQGDENGGAASIPVPMPDLVLPPSFDSDYPVHRYRFLDTANGWIIRPVLETHGWDHDVGYEGINVEKSLVIKDMLPVSFSGQITKDKKDTTLQMEVTSSLKHGKGKATSISLDMQTAGKDLAYTARGETRFCNYPKNKAAAGLSATLVGDTLSAGAKVEDRFIVGRRVSVVASGGAMTSHGDVASGASLEVQLRDRDYPIGRSLSTIGLSAMEWRGDLALGCNLQSQVPIGRSSNLIARGNLNNRGVGQLSVRLNSSEHLQLALIGLVPLIKKLFGYSQGGQ